MREDRGRREGGETDVRKGKQEERIFKKSYNIEKGEEKGERRKVGRNEGRGERRKTKAK